MNEKAVTYAVILAICVITILLWMRRHEEIEYKIQTGKLIIIGDEGYTCWKDGR